MDKSLKERLVVLVDYHDQMAAASVEEAEHELGLNEPDVPTVESLYADRDAERANAATITEALAKLASLEAMTEPITPSFNGVEIRVGDEVTLRMRVRHIENADMIGLVDLEDQNCAAYWAPVSDLASHNPAPRPLVPGPAILDGSKSFIITAVGSQLALGFHATDLGRTVEQAFELRRLRNTEGATS